MRGRSIAFVVVAALVVVSTAGTGIAAVASSGPADVKGTTTANESYTVERLSENGPRYANMHDSWRPIDDRPAAAWVRYFPSGGWVDTSTESSQWQYLEPSTVVKRNFVDLTVMDLSDRPLDETATLTVVYWQQETREVAIEGTNETRSEPYAANQTVERIKLDLGGPATETRIPLRPHYGEPYKVTMWLEFSEETARWTFTHDLKSAQATTTSTAGEDAIKVAKVVGIGAIFAVIAYGFGRFSNRRAITGPMKGSVWWLLVLGGGQLFGALAMWDTVANTIAIHPEILAVELLVVGLVQGIESKGYDVCYQATFMRPEVSYTSKTAMGEPGVESNGLAKTDRLLAQDDDGRLVVISPGIFPWLIRLIGGRRGRSYVEGTDEIRSSIEVTEGEGDLVFYTSPLADELLDYTPPAVFLKVPSLAALGIGVTVVGLSAGIGAVLGMGALAGAVLGGVVIPPLFVGVDARNAVFEPAPPHMSDAHANSMIMAETYSAVRSVDEAQDELKKAEAERHVARIESDQDRATSLVEDVIGAETSDEFGSRTNSKDLANELLGRLRDGDHRDDKGVTFGDD